MAKYKIIPSSRTIVQSPISIGHKAEKGVQAIEFDLTAWVETYGSGTLTVIMRRWGDTIPYPIALEIDENNKATWTLSDIDTAKAGMAYAQLSYIVGDEVVKKSDIYTFRVMDSLTGEGDPPEAYESWLEHLTHLAAEAMAEVLDIESIVTDKTLTVDGGIADAKAVGDELSEIKADLEDLDDRVDGLGDGVPTEVRQAMLALFNSAAYAETGLTDEIAVIESWAAVVTAISINQSSISISGASTSQLVATTTPAGGTVTWASSDTSVATASSSGLVTGVGNGSCTITASCGGKNATCSVTVSGFASLTGITATYTQSGTVYNTDTLDSLKSDLVVTASYSDSTTRTLSDSDYTLSGTLTVGTSTITVAYSGETTTFNATVTDSSAIQVTYTQGSIGSGNTDANRVSVVITSGIHFDDGESMVISVESGYSIHPFGFNPNTDPNSAGTQSSTNILSAYVVSDSSYVVPNLNDMNGTLYANTKSLNGKADAGWMTDTITYTFTKTGQYGYTFTGLGFLVKKDDNTDITPSEIEPLITINKVEASS